MVKNSIAGWFDCFLSMCGEWWWTVEKLASLNGRISLCTWFSRGKRTYFSSWQVACVMGGRKITAVFASSHLTNLSLISASVMNTPLPDELAKFVTDDLARRTRDMSLPELVIPAALPPDSLPSGSIIPDITPYQDDEKCVYFRGFIMGNHRRKCYNLSALGSFFVVMAFVS